MSLFLSPPPSKTRDMSLKCNTINVPEMRRDNNGSDIKELSDNTDKKIQVGLEKISRNE